MSYFHSHDSSYTKFTKVSSLCGFSDPQMWGVGLIYEYEPKKKRKKGEEKTLLNVWGRTVQAFDYRLMGLWFESWLGWIWHWVIGKESLTWISTPHPDVKGHVLSKEVNLRHTGMLPRDIRYYSKVPWLMYLNCDSRILVMELSDFFEWKV